MDDHLLPLAGDWSLWRDFAIRSAGFPVSGLDVFGAPDEAAGLAAVAKDPSFATAVIWQNRTAYLSAVVNLGGPAPGSGSKRRQREGVVAGYWQRYCSKNDTIGFFGPLAWGSVADDRPAVAVRAGRLVQSCEVHFESWCLEALARVIDTELVVPLNRHPERELRMQLEVRGDNEGLKSLDRLEEARDAVAKASGPDQVLAALEKFDACFEELTGTPPKPADDGA
ncbi:MAG TPA: lantibiotic dehydratase, partial [Candidatus Acidoferrum sp.]|nr:lantibiotic dehydratase [Candidatus Acidoferrum sp.]